ncbi:MAG: sulfotransferase [Nocardioidaceae bacterium]
MVGCQRSGTTVLRLMLDSHSQISCGPETRFLEDMERIVSTDWNRLARFGFDQEDWLRRIAAFFGGIHQDYAASRGKQRWADKSPRYALHMDFIARIFPDAQFVHVIRDARDVAVSHRKRFGYRSCVTSAVKWPRYIAAARASAARLQPGRYHELRYDDLVGDAEKTLRELLEFLGEEWEPQILEFDKTPHDVSDRYQVQLSSRQASAKTEDAVYRSRIGAYRRELDPMMRTFIWLTSRSELRQLGYLR